MKGFIITVVSLLLILFDYKVHETRGKVKCLKSGKIEKKRRRAGLACANGCSSPTARTICNTLHTMQGRVDRYPEVVKYDQAVLEN